MRISASVCAQPRCMKLRSGRAYGNMDTEPGTTREVANKLNQLYELGENLMTNPKNLDNISKLMQNVNLVYDTYNDLSSHSSTNNLPDTSTFKLDVDTRYWVFKQRFQQWFNSLSHSGKLSADPQSKCPQTAATTSHEFMAPTVRPDTLTKPVPVSSSSKVSKISQSHVVNSNGDEPDCEPEVGISSEAPTFSKVNQNVNLPKVSRSLEDLAPCAGIRSTLPPELPHTTSSLSQLKVEPFRVLSDASCFKELKFSKASVRSKSSRKSKSSRSEISSVSRLEEARVKLELARLTKRQNEERLIEEAEIERKRADMECQNAALEADIRRQKILSEDRRRLEAAELEVSLYHSQADTDNDDVSSLHRTSTKQTLHPQLKLQNTSQAQDHRNQFLRTNTESRQTGPKEVKFQIPSGRYHGEAKYGNFPKTLLSRPPRNAPETIGPLVGDPVISQVPNALATNAGSPPWALPQHYTRDASDQLLPKPSIKPFHGDPMDYWAFFNRFSCHIAEWLPPKKKMSYLLQHCSDKVCQHIQHLSDIHYGSCAYDLAWDELKRRYGQPHIIAQACEEKLINFPKIERDVAERLNKFTILMKRSCCALDDESVASNLDSIQFLTSLADKFPMDIKRQWVKAR